MAKQIVVCPYNGKSFSQKKEVLLHAVSKTQKATYCLLLLIWNAQNR